MDGYLVEGQNVALYVVLLGNTDQDRIGKTDVGRTIGMRHIYLSHSVDWEELRWLSARDWERRYLFPTSISEFLSGCVTRCDPV